MTDQLLQLRHISKTFPGVKALEDVAFDLRAGEVHALLGENGAGKSTLIKIVTGVLQPDTGAEISIAGEAVSASSPELAERRGVAAIYQHPTLFPELSVAENLMLEHGGAIISPRQQRADAQRKLERLAVDVPLDQPVRTLRMAEKQLLEISRALAQDARILIMDEPTAALPKKDADHLLQLIRQLREAGVGIVYISHRLEEIEAIADRMTILRDGRRVGTYRTDELQRQDIIRHMAGRPLDAMYCKEAVPIGTEMLEIENLSCAAGGIADISFAVRAGEIFGLAGLVGSGRTELARAVFGITPPDSGAIRVQGATLTVNSPAQAIAAGIGYVPEDRHQHGVVEDLPVVDNITITVLEQFTHHRFIDRNAEEQLGVEYVRKLGVRTPSLFNTVRNLSGGNQQKVALARWMAIAPKVLLLDEPTQGIDVGAKAEIYRLMEDLARQGVAIVMISSELPEVLGMSDRVGVMRQGRLVKVLDRGDATQETILEHAMERSHG